MSYSYKTAPLDCRDGTPCFDCGADLKNSQSWEPFIYREPCSCEYGFCTCNGSELVHTRVCWDCLADIAHCAEDRAYPPEVLIDVDSIVLEQERSFTA